ncbi:hypothetical protein ABK040_013451 [Willaertia magna]
MFEIKQQEATSTFSLHLEKLLEIIQFNNFKNEPINIYQFGSRVYGTAHENSDYDFFIIISDSFYQQLKYHYNYLQNINLIDINNLQKENIEMNKIIELNHYVFKEQWITKDKLNNIDKNVQEDNFSKMGIEFQKLSFTTNNITIEINLYNYSSFLKRLKKKNWLQSLMCYFLPIKFVWKCDFIDLHCQQSTCQFENIDYEHNINCDNNCDKICDNNITINSDNNNICDNNCKDESFLYYRKFIVSAIEEASKHFQLAKKNCNNSYLFKKYITHTFRDLLFTIQLIKFNKIINYKEANDIYFELMLNKSEDWNDYENKYYLRYQDLKNKINNLSMKSKLTNELDGIPYKNQLHTINYLQFGLQNNLKQFIENLKLYFSIKCYKKQICNNDENIVQNCKDINGYYYLKGNLKETPFYSPICLEVMNGLLFKYNLNNKNNIKLLTCPFFSIIPINNRYAYSLKIKNKINNNKKKGEENNDENIQRIWFIDTFYSFDPNILIYLFYDNSNDENGWRICSNNTLDGSDVLSHTTSDNNNEITTIKELFWRCFNNNNQNLFNEEEKDLCFVFEFISNEWDYCKGQLNNNLLNNCNDERITKFTGFKLISVKNRNTLLSVNNFEMFTTKFNNLLNNNNEFSLLTVKFTTKDKIKEFSSTLNPLKYKKFILLIGKYNYPLEIINPQYELLINLLNKNLILEIEMIGIFKTMLDDISNLELFKNLLNNEENKKVFDITLIKLKEIVNWLTNFYEEKIKDKIENIQLNLEKFKEELFKKFNEKDEKEVLFNLIRNLFIQITLQKTNINELFKRMEIKNLQYIYDNWL